MTALSYCTCMDLKVRKSWEQFFFFSQDEADCSLTSAL